jgi:hypothetical protein
VVLSIGLLAIIVGSAAGATQRGSTTTVNVGHNFCAFRAHGPERHHRQMVWSSREMTSGSYGHRFISTGTLWSSARCIRMRRGFGSR